MDVSVADAACVHLHQHLIGSGLRLRNVFDLPGTAHSGNDCSFHTLPPKAIGCERFANVASFCIPNRQSHFSEGEISAKVTPRMTTDNLIRTRALCPLRRHADKPFKWIG